MIGKITTFRPAIAPVHGQLDHLDRINPAALRHPWQTGGTGEDEQMSDDALPSDDAWVDMGGEG